MFNFALDENLLHYALNCGLSMDNLRHFNDRFRFNTWVLNLLYYFYYRLVSWIWLPICFEFEFKPVKEIKFVGSFIGIISLMIEFFSYWQFVRTWFEVPRTSGSGSRDLWECLLKFFTSPPGNPLVVKVNLSYIDQGTLCSLCVLCALLYPSVLWLLPARYLNLAVLMCIL